MLVAPFTTVTAAAAKTVTAAAAEEFDLGLVVRCPESVRLIVVQRAAPVQTTVKNQSATPSELHAALRISGGFDIRQMVSEFRALHASIMRLCKKASQTKIPARLTR